MTRNTLATLAVFSTALTVMTPGAWSAGGEEKWIEHSQTPKGDVHFFDSSRTETDQDLRRAWNRIRYKSSVMGASSYQSLLEIDCAEQSVRQLQGTFFSDKHWKKPAMATDKKAKRKRQIKAGSPEERLSKILCDR